MIKQRMIALGGVLLACTATIAAFTLPGSAAAAERPSDDVGLSQAAFAAATQAHQTGQGYVRFDGGYYDNTTDEVYVDKGARVMRLVGRRLVEAPPDDQPPQSPPLSGTAAPLSCSAGPRTHCETATCSPTIIYLNYTHDNFSTPWGSPVPYGGTIQVRNAPYRRVGPRGVRTFYAGQWTFVSARCVSGGF